MTVTATNRIRIRWAAADDRVAHAHRAGNAPRTLCGLPAIGDAFAWPEARRCLGCRNLADQLEPGS
jgi:hypothetical protein